MTYIKQKANRVGNISLATLGVRIIDTVVKSGIEEAAQTKQFRILNEVNNRYQAAIVPDDRVQKNEELRELYNSRNTLFADMYDYAEGLTKSPLPDMQAAATKVFTVLNKYGRNLSKVRLADLTIRYIRIIELLKNPELTPLLSKISLTAKVADFESLQLSYEDLYMSLGNDYVLRTAPSSLRKEMQNAVKNYAEELKWLSNNKDTDDWKTLYSNVEQRFNEMTVAQSRKKSAPAVVLQTTSQQADNQQTKNSAV